MDRKTVVGALLVVMFVVMMVVLVVEYVNTKA